MSSIRTIDLRKSQLSKSEYQRLLPRAEMDIDAATKAIEPILKQVREGDASTLIALCKKYDGVAPKELRVPRAELKVLHWYYSLRPTIEKSP